MAWGARGSGRPSERPEPQPLHDAFEPPTIDELETHLRALPPDKALRLRLELSTDEESLVAQAQLEALLAGLRERGWDLDLEVDGPAVIVAPRSRAGGRV